MRICCLGKFPFVLSTARFIRSWALLTGLVALCVGGCLWAAVKCSALRIVLGPPIGLLIL